MILYQDFFFAFNMSRFTLRSHFYFIFFGYLQAMHLRVYVKMSEAKKVSVSSFFNVSISQSRFFCFKSLFCLFFMLDK